MTESTLLNALFDSPNEGLILVDADGIITRMNAKASKLLEIPPESLIGQPETHLTRVYADFAPLFEGKVETVTIKGKGAIVVERYPLIVRRSVLGDGRRVLRVAVDVEQVREDLLMIQNMFLFEQRGSKTSIIGYADTLLSKNFKPKLDETQRKQCLMIIKRHGVILEDINWYMNTLASLGLNKGANDRHTLNFTQEIKDTITRLYVPHYDDLIPTIHQFEEEYYVSVVGANWVRAMLIRLISHVSPSMPITITEKTKNKTLVVSINYGRDKINVEDFEQQLEDELFGRFFILRHVVALSGGEIWTETDGDDSFIVHFTLPLAPSPDSS